MHDGTILDLAELHATPRRSGGVSVGKVVLAGVAAAMLGSVVSLGALVVQASRADGRTGAQVRLDLATIQQVEAMNVDDKAQIMAKGMDAERRNAEILADGAPLGKVSSFMVDAAQAAAYPAALKCLTQAVYYEAAVEPVEGRRAVAQVVLNRTRHPGYPKSICGVVYQGSERRTGCQFSFTCDGSLLRAPAARPWREAQDIARRALAGYVEKSVGTATHYHADYVLPKWAFQLGKIATLGRHIFYRFRGGWGKPAAFTGRYSMVEHIPAINFAALTARVEADGEVAALGALTPGLTVAPHVTDRHAVSDVGGRIDMTRQWRLSIPDPVSASINYRAAVGAGPAEAPPPAGKLVLHEASPGAKP